ncbi:MarP family serine protease [Glaciibacter superstes]|uniref:MarP family serine protease n=1 Tax=Glaciibacter superstes TaxID=501023 RepID=UPI0003B6B2A2|nr:MarP family serine protease [Glaciibacter superstes]
MNGPMLLDILLVLTLVVALVGGYRNGLLRNLSGLIGFICGAVAAFFAMPLVGAWVPAPEWRLAAVLGVALILLVAGVAIGSTLGRAMRRKAHKSKLRIVDRVLGAVFTLGVTALVMSVLGFSIIALGVPYLSPAIASSGVIRTIDSLTPDPVKSLLAQARSVALADGIPRIVEAVQGTTPQIPDVTADTPELAQASRSVVRVTGTAYACGRSQSGSGFVVSPDRVMTNAHVVAGVTEPVVQTQTGYAVRGTVVYFDDEVDLAIIAVDDLGLDPLKLGPNLDLGSHAVTQGYPFGGPFDSDPAEILTVGPLAVGGDGQTEALRQVYTLASDVQQGESGGPLLSEQGVVSGVIFAKGATTPNLGFALAMEEVQPVAEQSATLSSTVSSGACVIE